MKIYMYIKRMNLTKQQYDLISSRYSIFRIFFHFFLSFSFLLHMRRCPWTCLSSYLAPPSLSFIEIQFSSRWIKSSSRAKVSWILDYLTRTERCISGQLTISLFLSPPCAPSSSLNFPGHPVLTITEAASWLYHLYLKQ